MSNYNQNIISAIKTALSPARMATFEAAVRISDNEDPAAIELYAWNATISGALLTPLHVCEVTIRNAVSDALETIYGPRWPWSMTFERSLPDSSLAHSPRKDLFIARRSCSATGKVIPELKFVFWQKMFTGRYDTRIWDSHLYRIFPNLDQSLTIKEHRTMIYQELERLRKLRNRIAHHEPIFSRDLIDDYRKIISLIRCRCINTAEWLHQKQFVTSVLADKPKTITDMAHFITTKGRI
ncbi:hypothetical protein N5923_09735 [Erwiniaceae bacterium BAC15a-03b]|uniref:Abi-like protein n=1 Tax=Winslowiella arboricola TaxID=2978220 RepID=A0A9J6PSN8_9GAMM|nr:hypothetical protein [Winslowiella arboricola]MCU5773862.1 hypothetical protein [Winslowiella arboricola]MCU5777772.1 hypothetical protein [Winslowiella arboricola]